MQDINEIKSQLRKTAHENRKNVTKSEKTAIDKRIAENLFSLKEFINAESVFVYVSKSDEIDTEKIINFALNSEKIVAVPKCCPKSHTMDFYAIGSLDCLSAGYKGIKEPSICGVPIIPSSADIVILPMLSADKDFNRLGYGGGYYDRYLSDKTTLCVGLCYSDNLLDRIPASEYDIPIDIIVTENEIYRREHNYG